MGHVLFSLGEILVKKKKRGPKPCGQSCFCCLKFLSVMYSCCSLGGVAMVSLSDLTLEDSIPTGALWSLASAMLYAFYLVMVRRRVGHEERMDIPMFFGE